MVASFSYDDGMRRVGRTLGDTPGAVTTTTYGRADNLPTAIADNRGIVSFGYTYDANKNKLSETLASPMAAYGFGSTTPCTYDNEDRLTAWHRDDGNLNESWTLSSAGDWLQYYRNQLPPRVESFTPVHESNSYAYDPNGNLTPAAMDLTWDFDNRLKHYQWRNFVTGDFTYDALGRRVSRIFSGYNNAAVYVNSIVPLAHSPHAGQEVAEYAPNAEASTPTKKYVYGDYIDEPVMMVKVNGGEAKYYYHQNNIYSVAALTKQDGSVQNRYAYGPYGESTASLGTDVGNEYRFTGRRCEKGFIWQIYYYRARYYNVYWGRFMGRDPIGYWGGVNLYEYVRDNPTNKIDPNGLWPGFPSLPVPFPPTSNGPKPGFGRGPGGFQPNNPSDDNDTGRGPLPVLRPPGPSPSPSPFPTPTPTPPPAPVPEPGPIGCCIRWVCRAGGAVAIVLCDPTECGHTDEIHPPPPPPECKNDKWYCSTKARGCCPSHCGIYHGEASTKSIAKAISEGRCQAAGCHTPGGKPYNCNCGHTTCYHSY